MSLQPNRPYECRVDYHPIRSCWCSPR